MTQSVPERPRGGARRAVRSSRWPSRPRLRAGGDRVRRTRRRARSLPSTLGLTALAAFVPGSGYLYAGRRLLGAVVLVAWLALVGGLAWYFGGDIHRGLHLAFRTTTLRLVVAAGAVALLVWVFVLVTSYRLVRPRVRPQSHTVLGYLTVGVLAVGLGTPFVVAGNYALVTATAVEKVFPENPLSPTAPTGATEADPWGGQDQVNVLLLGGDGGVGRTGVRTDSVILASMDTRTGRTTTFSLPRNMMYAQFPDGSPLHAVYPNGYGKDGTLDPSFYELNAIYGQVPLDYPHILGTSDNEGADAVKEAVAGSLGIPVDYYMLINLAGFQQVVDAMGGITVNINEPVAINGNTDLDIPPTGYLEPGPHQHLDGFHALWFARGRYGADDYQRMDRQRCAVDALIQAADPSTLLTHYIDVARAGEQVVTTDIPRRLGPAFADLLLKVKDAKVRSVVFRASDKFYSGDPDYDYVRSVVSKALDPPRKKHGAGHRHVSEVENPVDVCGYHPIDGTSPSDGSSAVSG